MKPIKYEGDKSRIYSTAATGDTFGEVINRRFSRRSLMAIAVRPEGDRLFAAVPRA